MSTHRDTCQDHVYRDKCDQTHDELFLFLEDPSLHVDSGGLYQVWEKKMTKQKTAGMKSFSSCSVNQRRWHAIPQCAILLFGWTVVRETSCYCHVEYQVSCVFVSRVSGKSVREQRHQACDIIQLVWQHFVTVWRSCVVQSMTKNTERLLLIWIIAINTGEFRKVSPGTRWSRFRVLLFARQYSEVFSHSSSRVASCWIAWRLRNGDLALSKSSHSAAGCYSVIQYVHVADAVIIVVTAHVSFASQVPEG